MSNEFFNFTRKVSHYKEILANTANYRNTWEDGLRQMLVNFLEEACQKAGLDGKVEVRTDLKNLEAVALSLGEVKSGLYQKINSDIDRHLIKNNGALIYQQLFNGKIIVLVQFPFIENYGQPSPPKTIAIYRPEELSRPFLIRHLEEFIQEIADWEDYDDDEPNKKIGFELNFNPPGEQD